MRIVMAAAMFAVLGCAVGTAEDAKPVWREDTSHLAEDLREIRSCFVSAVQHVEGDESNCLDLPASTCQSAMGEDAASTTLGQRQCNWRAIAAWEEILAESITELNAEQRPEERAAFAESQKAWLVYLDANVRAHAAHLEGGTLANVVAGQERAKMLIARAIEVRHLRAERRE